MIRGTIFDLGGTLIAPYPGNDEQGERANAESLLRWLRGQSLRVDDGFVGVLVAERAASFERRARLEGHREIRVSDVLRAVLRRYGLATDRDFLEAAERAFYAPEVAGVRPLDGAHDVLRWLRGQHIRAGVASNATSHYVVTELCRAAALAPFLDPIVSSALIGWAKPDPRIFDTILQHWKLTPEAVIMVGDTVEADIVGGSRLGMRTVLITHSSRGRASSFEVAPDAIAPDLPTVGRIIEEWLAPD